MCIRDSYYRLYQAQARNVDTEDRLLRVDPKDEGDRN